MTQKEVHRNPRAVRFGRPAAGTRIYDCGENEKK